MFPAWPLSPVCSAFPFSSSRGSAFQGRPRRMYYRVGPGSLIFPWDRQWWELVERSQLPRQSPMRSGSRRGCGPCPAWVPPRLVGSPGAPWRAGCRWPRAQGRRAGTRRPRPAHAAGVVSPAAAAEQPWPLSSPVRRSLPVAVGPHEWPRAAPAPRAAKHPTPASGSSPAPSRTVTFLAPALPSVPK